MAARPLEMAALVADVCLWRDEVWAAALLYMFNPLSQRLMEQIQSRAQAETSIFAYQGANVTFSKGESVMINATEMAKPFGKRAVDWLQNAATQEFLSALSEVRKSTSADLVQVTKGGANQGTWMHEDVALEFARWLSPAFAIWCNDRIKELLTTGVTTTANDDETILKAMQVLQNRVSAAQAQLEAANKTIEQQAPKVLFADSVSASSTSILIGDLAKILKQNGYNTGQKRLFEQLRSDGFLVKRKGADHNSPTQRAMELGLFEVKETSVAHSDGHISINRTTKVTGKGQVYFVNRYVRQ